MISRQYLVRGFLSLTAIFIVLVGLTLGYRLFVDVRGIEAIQAVESEHMYAEYAVTRESKKVSLTFDDGPHPVHTQAIMDVLDAHDMPATFFVIGKTVVQNPDIAKSIVVRGYDVGLHSFTHSRDAHMTKERLEWELSATRYAVETATGVSPRIYRPPFQIDITAVVTDYSRVTGGPLQWIRDFGYIPVGADADSYDWSVKSESDILTQVKLSLHRGNVLVFHDTEHTAKALPMVFALLAQEGYEVVALEELMGLGGTLYQPVGEGFSAPSLIDRVSLFAGAKIFSISLILLGIAVVLVLLRLALVGLYLSVSFFRSSPQITRESRALVSVVIPAWNEEENIEATMRSVLSSRGVKIEMIVVDDGSTDRTFETASRIAKEASPARVTVLRKKNGGKASALNAGIAHARGIVIVCLDADTIFTPDTVLYLTQPFSDPSVGAVSGKVAIAGSLSLLTRMQLLEYFIGQNVQRRAFQMANAINVIPGAVGAWRKRDIELVGGVPTDTLVEDHDLTLAILNLGRRIVYEPRAVAYTEAPETISAFMRQRTRWVQGAMQCVMKYRSALWSRKVPWGMRLAIASALAFDLFLPLYYPIVDLILIGSIVTGTFSYVALPLLVFFILDLAIVYLAVMNEEKKEYTLVVALLMRVLYRHLLFYAYVVSLLRFIEGRSLGWQKCARTGQAQSMYFGTLRPVPSAIASLVRQVSAIFNKGLLMGYGARSKV